MLEIFLSHISHIMRYLLKNLNVAHENKKLNRNAHNVSRSLFRNTYYKSKLLQIKLPLFHVFHGLHELNFLEIYVYVNKAILLIFDIPQIVFDFIIYDIVT